MSAAGAEAVVLVGGSRSVGPDLDLEVVDDLWPGEGPLAGLASAVHWAAEAGANAVLVSACDQPNLTAEVFDLLHARLLAAGAGRGGAGAGGVAVPDGLTVAGAVTVAADGRRNPFPAAWLTAGAAGLRALVSAGHRRADAAFELGVETVAVAGEVVADVDRPEDLPDEG